MKKIIYFFVIALLIGFVSCNKDDEEIVEKENIEIRVKAFYETNTSSDIQFDNGAKVFVYYGFFTMDIIGYDYKGDGKLVKGDSIILPEQSATIERDGLTIIKPKYIDRITTIIVESRYFTGIIASTSYLDLFESPEYSVYFKQNKILE